MSSVLLMRRISDCDVGVDVSCIVLRLIERLFMMFIFCMCVMLVVSIQVSHVGRMKYFSVLRVIMFILV